MATPSPTTDIFYDITRLFPSGTPTGFLTLLPTLTFSLAPLPTLNGGGGRYGTSELKPQLAVYKIVVACAVTGTSLIFALGAAWTINRKRKVLENGERETFWASAKRWEFKRNDEERAAIAATVRRRELEDARAGESARAVRERAESRGEVRVEESRGDDRQEICVHRADTDRDERKDVPPPYKDIE